MRLYPKGENFKHLLLGQSVNLVRFSSKIMCQCVFEEGGVKKSVTYLTLGKESCNNQKDYISQMSSTVSFINTVFLVVKIKKGDLYIFHIY